MPLTCYRCNGSPQGVYKIQISDRKAAKVSGQDIGATVFEEWMCNPCMIYLEQQREVINKEAQEECDRRVHQIDRVNVIELEVTAEKYRRIMMLAKLRIA